MQGSVPWPNQYISFFFVKFLSYKNWQLLGRYLCSFINFHPKLFFFCFLMHEMKWNYFLTGHLWDQHIHPVVLLEPQIKFGWSFWHFTLKKIKSVKIDDCLMFVDSPIWDNLIFVYSIFPNFFSVCLCKSNGYSISLY